LFTTEYLSKPLLFSHSTRLPYIMNACSGEWGRTDTAGKMVGLAKTRSRLQHTCMKIKLDCFNEYEERAACIFKHKFFRKDYGL